MASSRGSEYLFLFLLSLFVASSYAFAERFPGGKLKVSHPSRRGIFGSFHFMATQHDLIYPPVTTTYPTTTPGIVSPGNSAPTVANVPGMNPIGVTPNPVATPSTVPPTTPVPVPITNPVTPAVPVTNPTPSGALPVTSPVTNPTPAPITTNSPAVPGQSWCVAKSGASQIALQAALDYACGMGGADCSTIQQGEICYNPNALQNHASVAFNNYYQKNPTQMSCDFGGTAMITNTNPSSGSCIFATLSSSSSPATLTNPPTTAFTSGATPSGVVAPPSVLNASNPTSGGTSTGFGESPPTSGTLTGLGDIPPTSSTSISVSIRLRPAIGCILLVIIFTFTRITAF